MKLTLLFIFINFVHAADYSSLISRALSDQIKQSPAHFVLIQIWSPFCVPCGKEVQEINQALEQINSKRQFDPIKTLSAIGIPVKARHKEISSFTSHFRPEYPQWSPDQEFLESFSKINSVPLTLLFSKKERLKLVQSWAGTCTKEDLMLALNNNSKQKKGEI